MSLNNYISRFFAFSLLLVILYSHSCSLLCSLEVWNCCSEKCEATEHNEKCNDENETPHDADTHHHDEEANSNHESKNGCDGCQTEHLNFFSAIGKNSTVTPIVIAKPIQHLISVINAAQNFIPVSKQESIIAYNGFHPPPPKGNIIILKRSFLI